MTICVIPAFRAADTVVDVVRSALPFVDVVIVVDDFCPEECGVIVTSAFANNPNVEVLRHQANRGVGGAMKSGIRRALQLGADVVVKIDADGQMDPQQIPEMVRILADHPRLALVKGNRFFDSSVARVMPGARLLGNSALTLLVRMSSGYWNCIDPTNGYIAIRADRLRRMKLERLADRFFFEISLLCRLGMHRADIAELDIPARYNGARSNLSIGKIVAGFPGQLGSVFLRRIIWQYVVSDMNVGSLFLIAGALLLAGGAALGATSWIEALRSGIPRTPGTVGVVFVPLFMGFQLLLNAILYDVQSAPRVLKFQPSLSIAGGERSAWDRIEMSAAAVVLESLPRP
jgi:dolichol-phosphate mannosyltransferase